MRVREMTKAQLAALKHLPAVIDALEAMGREADKLRALMAKAGGTPTTQLAPATGGGFQQSAPVNLSPAQAERKAYLESMKGQRAELLSQFKKDDVDAEYEAQMAHEREVGLG